MKKVEKSAFVEELTSTLKSAKNVVVVDYTGLGVANQRELKKRLKPAGARFVVIKNTLFKIAAKKADISPEMLTDTVLSGQNGLILSDEDPVTPLTVVTKFAAEFEKPKLKVGMLEGSYVSQEDLTSLSKLGSKSAVVGQLIGTLMAPSYQTVAVLGGKLQELIYVLSAKAR